MKVKIIPIGNSQGIRIPKSILKQCNFDEEVEIKVENGKLVIQRTTTIREGWSEAFADMATQGDDQLLDGAPDSTEWDEEWEWS